MISLMSVRQRWKLVLLSAACIAIPACKARPRVQHIAVHIYRELSSPYAQQIDYRMLEFQATNPRLSNGWPIQLDSVSVGETSAILNNMEDPAVDVVILDSPLDAGRFTSLQGEMGHAVNVCAAVLACPAEVPALVPSKLAGQRAEAANKFLQYLATAKPEPRPAEAPPAAPTGGQPAQPGQSAQSGQSAHTGQPANPPNPHP